MICGASYYNARMGSTHTCELPPGHDGKHRCALCGGEWPDVTPTLTDAMEVYDPNEDGAD